MHKIRWFIWIVGIALAVTLALQNNTSQDINLLWYTWNLPISLLLLAMLGIGFLCGSVMTVMTFRRSRRKAESRSAASEPATTDLPVGDAPAAKSS